MSFLIALLLFLLTDSVEVQSLPYKVLFDCPETPTGSSTLRLKTNVSAVSAAVCAKRNEPMSLQQSFADPSIHLKATLDQAYPGTDKCVFKFQTTQEKMIFGVLVLVKWTDDKGQEHLGQHSITCEFDPPTTAPPLANTTTPPPTTARPTAMAKSEDPIIHFKTSCPKKMSQRPTLHLVAEVPAHVKAACNNGPAVFDTENDVDYFMVGRFDQSYSGEDCLFYKKKGSNTFTVDVDVGWGEKDGKVITQSRTRTVSCSYDQHGNTLSEQSTIEDWFLSPNEIQSRMGVKSETDFELKLLDVLDEEIDDDKISIGRKIRLMAKNKTSGVKGFRALSCIATNGKSQYAVLRAGCGDGLVFPKSKGFWTEGSVVYSPFFDAFRLTEVSSIRFECNFTVCASRCDGSSCPSERKKRSFLGGPLKYL